MGCSVQQWRAAIGGFSSCRWTCRVHDRSGGGPGPGPGLGLGRGVRLVILLLAVYLACPARDSLLLPLATAALTKTLLLRAGVESNLGPSISSASLHRWSG